MSHCDKGFDQPCVFRGFKGLLHVPPGMRIGDGMGLSQNRINLTVVCHVIETVRSALDFSAK
jgi:hypothetical protein